jgi:hypothetical protein
MEILGRELSISDLARYYYSTYQGKSHNNWLTVRLITEYYHIYNTNTHRDIQGQTVSIGKIKL